jgi:hypothetical protein
MADVSLVNPGGTDPAAVTLAAWGRRFGSLVRSSAHGLVHNLSGATANRAAMRRAFSDCELFVFFGHGDDDALLNGTSRIVDSRNAPLGSGRLVVAIACRSATHLGVDMVAKGSRAYLGWTRDLRWITTRGTTSEMRTGDAIHDCLAQLSNGDSFGTSHADLETRLDSMVDYFDRDPVGKKETDAIWSAMFANWNRSHVKLLGMPGASI